MMSRKITKKTIFSFLSPLVLGGLSMAASADTVNWGECPEEVGPDFDCTTYYVTLDYQDDVNYDKDSGYIGISMIRYPARDQENKKGSILMNPGGPGGSGFDFVRNAGPWAFNEAVLEQYDIVGFDPRGIGRSSQLTCFLNYEEMQPLFLRAPFPINEAQVDQRELVDQHVSDLCTLNAGDLIDHMSTADVARDMDEIRKGLGEDKLNFVGVSYGTYLGAVYANLFPENVGAMILDGVLDPVAWSTGRSNISEFLPFSSRLKSAEGARDSLHEFFRTCDEAGTELCSFAGNSEERYYALLDSLRETPLLIEESGFSYYVDYQYLVWMSAGSLYNPFSWESMANTLSAVEGFANPDEVSRQFSAWRHELGYSDPEIPSFQPLVSFAGVACSDSDNPATYDRWTFAAAFDEARFGVFGPYWSWISSICHSWPGSKESRFVGDFKAKTDSPVLLVSTLYDPATPYHGAQTLNKLMDGSSLLTVNGWGHGTLFGSACVRQIEEDYLLNGTLPGEGTVCDQDYTPFGASLPLSSLRSSASVDSALSAQSATQNTNGLSKEDARELKRKALREIRPLLPF